MTPRVQGQGLGQPQGPTFTQVGFCSAHKKKLIFLVVSLIVLISLITVCAYNLKEDDYSDKNSSESLALLQNSTVKVRPRVTDVRLPTELKPYFYKLALIPYLDASKNFTIDGTVSIDLICKDATDRIIVNIKNISIHEASVKVRRLNDVDNLNVNVTVLRHEYDLDRDFYKVILNESLVPGKSYRLSLEYRAVLSDQLVGFYRSSYVQKATNETRWLGVTQFSPTDARRAFPCFDEPAFKAKYEISLGRLENMTSLSNMNLLRTEPITNIPGFVWDHYAQTLPMSTYLVGFAVTDFVARASDAEYTKPKFQVWAREDAINQTDYARAIGPRVLAYFEKYFGIEFPLPKLDMIAVPDHRFSAMENWGLITFRELVLLFDPDYSSDSDKRRIAEVLSHELAHQWFGKVTPSWWSDLWLKEGFASYMEYLGVDQVEPNWKILELFVINELQTVFRMDTLNSSHPISIPVNHPDQINQIFDAISYAKGCTIIRMMDHFLSHPTFKQGLTNYLNKWKYNNTRQDDLWESLTEQAHRDGTLPASVTVAEVMDTWTLQKGYPVISVARDYDTGIINFNQSKFNYRPASTLEEDAYLSSFKWYVPISYASPSDNSDFLKTAPRFWIGKHDNTIGQAPGVIVDKNDWFIINVQSTGYYRVNYDIENWHRIEKQLQTKTSRIHIVNQAQIIDDSLALARASLLHYDIPLNLSLYLRKQKEYLPWEAYFENLNHLSNMLHNTSANEMLQSYVKYLLQDEYPRLGFIEQTSDSVLERAHRAHILDWACKLEYSDCVQNAVDLFKTWMENTENDAASKNLIPINLRGVVYCTAIKHGGEKEWNFARNQYLNVNVASEKDRILTALACSRNATIIKNYLNDAVTPGSFIRKQDSRNVLQRVGNTQFGNSLTFQFLQAEFPRIQRHFGPGLSIDKIINTAIGTKLKTPDDLTQMLKFKKDYEGQFGFGDRAVEEAIEIVQTNIYWMNHNYDSVVNWLTLNFKN